MGVRLKALLLAGSFEQARFYAQHMGLEKGEWFYVAPHSSRGLRGIPAYIVGTFWDRREADDIFNAILPVEGATFEEIHGVR